MLTGFERMIPLRRRQRKERQRISTQCAIDWQKSISMQKYNIEISDLAEQDLNLLLTILYSI